MKRNLFLCLALIFLLIILSGCDSQNADSSTPSDFEQAENPPWISPEISSDAQASGGSKEQPLSDSAFPPGEPGIATPLVPFFEIITAKLHECDGLHYVVVKVKNTGPYYFQRITFYLTNGFPSSPKEKWEDPWSSLGDSQCPVPTSGEDSLAPGASAHIYYQITTDYAAQYNLVITMCTYRSYNSDPSPCHTESYYLMESLWADKPVLKIKDLVLCWVGPGPLYEVVNSIPEGSTVELLGIGDVEGYLVVQEPKYQRPCWLLSESAEDVPEEVSRGLTNVDSPILSAGVVNGRVFKDQDGNGAFGGADVGFPGAQVSLAPGSCSNGGQAISTTTNAEGWYAFYDVAPGTYCIYAAKPTTCQSFTHENSFGITVKWESLLEKNFGLGGCR